MAFLLVKPQQESRLLYAVKICNSSLVTLDKESEISPPPTIYHIVVSNTDAATNIAQYESVAHEKLTWLELDHLLGRTVISLKSDSSLDVPLPVKT